MNRLGFLCVALMLSGCYVVHHPVPTARKAATKTIAPVQKMETISIFTGVTCCEPRPNEDPGKRTVRLAKEGQEYQDAFTERFKVTWPEGSSVQCDWKDGTVVHVTNTAENLLKIIQGMSDEARNPNQQIEMDVQIVEAGRVALAALGIHGQGHLDVTAEKREMLLKREDVRLLETFHFIVKNGQESVVKSVTEYIYPTEYLIATNAATSGETPCVSGNATVVPANFELREVGTCFQVVPELRDLCNRIDFLLSVTVTGEPVWKDYGPRNPHSETNSCRLPMEQPFFPCRQISTRLIAEPDKTIAMVMGGLALAGGGSSDKVLILFLTPHFIHTQDGSAFTPIRLP